MGTAFHAQHTAGIAVTAATAKTVLQLVAAANHRVLVREFGIFVQGVVATDTPGKVELMLQSTAGTSSALTLVKEDTDNGETLQTTAVHTCTAEPTTTTTRFSCFVHPQRGFIYRWPKDRELVILGGERLGIRCTFAQNQTVDAYFKAEE